MKSAGIAVGIAFIPMILLAVGVLLMIEPDRRRRAVRHPIRYVADTLRSED